jgi:hypothetical protein
MAAKLRGNSEYTCGIDILLKSCRYLLKYNNEYFKITYQPVLSTIFCFGIVCVPKNKD